MHEVLTEKATLSATTVRNSYPQAKEPIPDDDASIIRVCGFALHSAIAVRQKALLKNQQHKHSEYTLSQYKNKLELCIKKTEGR